MDKLSKTTFELKLMETNDDPDNFGLHVNDHFNVSDEHGNVVINIGHAIDEPTIFLAPQIAKVIKPYQIGGIRFLYDNIIRKFNTPGYGGCVLAHSMGLGKTLQIVSFCEIFLQHTKSKTILCIVPVNTIANWIAEFNKWLPCAEAIQSPNDIMPRKFNVFTIGATKKTLTERSEVIIKWNHEGGVLVLGYELFKSISFTEGGKKRIRKRIESEEDFEKAKQLSNDMQVMLLNTDLVVCDEGHRIKNMHAETSVALKQIRTKRRIVLSGYPLQNNCIEYWCMIDFIQPNYLGSQDEFRELFHIPIEKGHCANASPEAVKLMQHRSFVIHTLLSDIVQRRSHIVLKDLLPPIMDYIILLKMTPLQKGLYRSFVTDSLLVKQKISPIKGFAACSKIFNHPDILYAHVNDVGFDWCVQSMKGYTPNLIENSPKILIFLNILQEILLLGDRMLVFSQSLSTLDLLERFIQANATNNIVWKKDWNYFRMDGSCTSSTRDKLVNEFNTNRKILLFLLSTKACSHGINLTGANRVIIFDSSWNPCYEQQALCRVYRHEQTKSCFVYRLIMDKCLEKRIYNRQVNKQGIANRIIDERNPQPKFSCEEMKKLFSDADDDNDEPKTSNFTNETYSDMVMEKVCTNFSKLMGTPPFLHDTMLTENQSTTLAMNEKLSALNEYKSQKRNYP